MNRIKTDARGVRTVLNSATVLASLIALTLLEGVGALAGVITPASDSASSFYGATQAPINLINGSGLLGSGDILTQTHNNNSSAGGMWHSSGGLVSATWVSFDLGAQYTLRAAYIWQMNQAGNLGRGVKTFSLFTSPTTTDPITNYVGTFSLAKGSGTTNEAHQTFTFAPANARQVLLAISNDWSGLASDYVGLSEVRFEGALTPPPVVTLSVTNALAGYWNFNEGSGSVAADLSGFARSGLVHNTPEDGGQWTVGKVGGSLRFRGDGLGGDYVTVSPWPALQNGQWSVSAWVLSETNQNNRLTGTAEDSGQTSTFAQEPASLPPASWQHVVMVADGQNLMVYRNGTLAGSSSYDGTFFIPTNVFAIGAILTVNGVPSSFWQGRIDEVACWTRGLNADDIFRLYAAGTGGKPLLSSDSYSNAAPILATPLQGGNFYANTALRLGADATGLGPLTYQWWKDGVLLANATNRVLSNPGAGFSASGRYSVVVTDRNGRSIASAQATVTITVPTLDIAPAGAGVVLAWPSEATGYLAQSAPAVDGPWSVIPSASTNALVLTPTNPARFFRLFHK